MASEEAINVLGNALDWKQHRSSYAAAIDQLSAYVTRDATVDLALATFIVEMQRTGTTREGLRAALKVALR